MRTLSILLALLVCLPAFGDATGLGYVLQIPDSVRTVLVAESSTATLRRFSNIDGELRLAETQPMSIGENGVAKERNGDRRTPLGVYFVIEELDTRNLHDKYGPVAFPLDYPNAWDNWNARTGSGIWIHGVEPGSGARPARDTDGCIALQNQYLLELGTHLDPLQTPVIVTREIDSASPEELAEMRDRLLTVLDDWASSYRVGDWYQYLSLYSKDFMHHRMDKEAWSAYRVRTAAARPLQNFSISEVLLMADPEDPELFLSRFRQHITEAGRVTTTTKRLYWRVAPDGQIRIVAEDNG